MKRALITIHGYLTNPDDFGVLYDKADFYDQVFKFVIPGHDGDYKEFEKQTTLDVLLAYYDSQLDGKFDQIDVVGFSLGGALACYLATQRKVDKVVLLAPCLKVFNSQSVISKVKYRNKLVSKQLNLQTDVGFFQKQIDANKVADAYMKRYYDVVVDWLKNTFPHVTIGNVNELFRLVRVTNKQLAKRGKLPNKALCIWGKCDQFVSYKAVQIATEHFENLQVIIHDELDHTMLRIPQNNYVADEVVSFLQQK